VAGGRARRGGGAGGGRRGGGAGGRRRGGGAGGGRRVVARGGAARVAAVAAWLGVAAVAARVGCGGRWPEGGGAASFPVAATISARGSSRASTLKRLSAGEEEEGLLYPPPFSPGSGLQPGLKGGL
jgi:hypothetical protein